MTFWRSLWRKEKYKVVAGVDCGAEFRGLFWGRDETMLGDNNREGDADDIDT